MMEVIKLKEALRDWPSQRTQGADSYREARRTMASVVDDAKTQTWEEFIGLLIDLVKVLANHLTTLCPKLYNNCPFSVVLVS